MLDSIHRRLAAIAPALVLVVAFGEPAQGQAFEQRQVSPALGTATQKFGSAVEVKGDLLVVGAPEDDTQATNAGAAHVFRWNAATASWAHEAQLFPSDPEADAKFGCDVVVDGDVVVVGASFEDNALGVDAGAVYAFRRDPVTGAWSEEQKLTSAIGAADDEYGHSVALVGNVLLVGAPEADTSLGSNSGIVHVYRWHDPTVMWVAETTLLDPNGMTWALAGISVDFDGSTAVVGSDGTDIGGNFSAGTASVWSVSSTTWTHVAEFRSVFPESLGCFGCSVGVSGDQIVVGEWGHSGLFLDEGACHLFRRSGGSWARTAYFPNPDPDHGDLFGWSVAIQGDRAVACGYLDDFSVIGDYGLAYSFRRSKAGKGWFLDQALGASDADISDYFGTSVALSVDHLVIGAPNNNTAAGTDWGVVYDFDPHEINVTIEPADPLPGETMAVRVFDGEPGDPVLLVIDEVDGVPTWIEVLFATFGADHRLALDVDAEIPLLGMNVGVRAWKVSPTGALVASERVHADV